MTPPVQNGPHRPSVEEAGQQRRASVGILYALLAAYSGRRIQSGDLVHGPHGKPYLPGGPQFNMSHSAGSCAMAMAAEEVGIDIEHPERIVDACGLARRCFQRDEACVVESSRAPCRAFLDFWVCKEAMAKLAGEGIYRGMRHTHVTLQGGVFAGRYRGRTVHLSPIGSGVGMVGVVASWKKVPVKVFVIDGKSATMRACHS